MLNELTDDRKALATLIRKSNFTPPTFYDSQTAVAQLKLSVNYLQTLTGVACSTKYQFYLKLDLKLQAWSKARSGPNIPENCSFPLLVGTTY